MGNGALCQTKYLSRETEESKLYKLKVKSLTNKQ